MALVRNYWIFPGFQSEVQRNRVVLGLGCVNQALAQALGEVLKDYYVFVAQLETQHRLGELTLNKMWSYIQPTMDAMAFMSDLCSTIDRYVFPACLKSYSNEI